MQTEGNAKKKISVTVHNSEQNGIEILIHDNGIGIASTSLNKIFDFGYTTKINGHGFGLYSSALLAKELGGSLEAESKGKGEGATFKLILPAIGQEVAK